MNELLTRLLSQPLTRRNPDHGPASCAIVSLPWPREKASAPALREGISQSVPLFDPDNPPPLPRYLLLTSASDTLPESLLAAQRPADYEPECEVCSAVAWHATCEGTEPYLHREDEAVLAVGDRQIGLRLGLEFDGEYSWWQWTRAELLWSGPVAEAWRIGGHIAAHPHGAAPPCDQADDLYGEMACYGGLEITADLFLIVFHTGVISITAHFKNNFWFVPPQDLPGLPVIGMTDLQGDFPETALDSPEVTVLGSGADRLGLHDCCQFFAPEHPGSIRCCADALAVGAASSRDGRGKDAAPTPLLVFRPFDHIEIITHKTKKNEFHYLGERDQKGLPAGVSRTVRFAIGLDGNPPVVARYQPPPLWYGLCGEFNGQSQEPVTGPAQQWSAASRDLIYSHVAVGGFDTGRVWRYLRRDLRSGTPQIDDAEWEGGTAQALMLDAYLRPEAARWDLIMHQAYHYADIAVHHGVAMVRCHGYRTLHVPLPMMRVGALVYGYLETGDSYLLETARAVADSFMRMDEGNQPRHSIGRDAYPLAGLMALYDRTGDGRYLNFGRQLVIRLLSTQTEAGAFSGQGGVGLMGGACNRWKEDDISFGSGLLAPIGLLEWALRDDRHPPGFARQMARWYELVLGLQHEPGYWTASGKPEDASYPLIPGGLLFSLSAYHRLFGDDRGLRALERYLRYAQETEEYLQGTHSFLGVLYAEFYALENQSEVFDQGGVSCEA